MTPAEAASPSGPPLPGPTAQNVPSQDPTFGALSGNAPSAPRPDTYPQLRRVSSAFPGIAPRNPDQPPPQRAPALGIFSGKPMPQWTTPVPLGGLLENSNTSGDSDWFNLLAGLVSRNSTQPEQPQQTASSKPERRLGRRVINQSPAPAYDPGAPAAPLAQSDDANYSGGLLDRFAALAGIDPNQPALPSPDDERQ